MNINRSKLGLSILAGGLSFVGSAAAVELVVNGSFESAAPIGWQYFSTYNYSLAYFSGPPIPASENPGTRYSYRQASAFSAWDHYSTPMDETQFLNFNLAYAASQVVALTNALSGAAIDAGKGGYQFSSWLASYGNPGSNPEQPYLVLRFYDDGLGTQIGSNVIFDRTKNTFAIAYADGSTTIPADLSGDHNWIKYSTTGLVPAGARKAKIFLTRSPNADKVNSPDTYMDLVSLNVINVTETTEIAELSPGNGQTNVAPNLVIAAKLLDLNTQVNTNSIQLALDGVSVVPSIQKSNLLTSIRYEFPGVLAPLSAHTYRLVWSDTGPSVTTKTNLVSFMTAPYVPVYTGTPFYQENFDSVTEGGLPAGWSVSNATDSDLPGPDLNNFHSDTYQDWTVLSRATLSNLFGVTPGGSDYTSLLEVAPNQVLNGVVQTELLSNKFVLAASDARFGNQIQHLDSPSYNLSGRANVTLAFKSVFTQNQDSMGAVEYSIDGGASWKPALYMLDTADLVASAQGGIDASNTFAAIHADVPGAGNYGAFISVAQNQWASTAPFISGRVNDDSSGSHRLEAVRLAGADNQPSVRFRFTNLGSDSYFFAIDDFVLYGGGSTNPPVVSAGPAEVLAAVGNSASFSASAFGIGPLSYQWRHAGTNLAGANGPTLSLSALRQANAGAYDVIVTGGAGSVTSAPALNLSLFSAPAFVTGQWDFNGADLAASLGRALEYYDGTVAADTTFGSTTSFGISSIGGKAASVMHFVPSGGGGWGGYEMFHGAPPNGGGFKLNQYTLIFDIYYPAASQGTWRALLQGSLDNNDDAELFVNPDGGLGVSSIYEGLVTSEAWHRIAVGVDLAGPGPHPVLSKFIDGVKVAEQPEGLYGVDGRFSLLPSGLLFADNDGDTHEAYVSSIQFSSGRCSDAYLQALGGATASKIPGLIRAGLEGSSVVIRWSGDVGLESADELAGPWSSVAGSSPYTVSTPLAKKFYRIQLP